MKLTVADTVLEMVRRGVSRFGVGLDSGIKILKQCAALPGGAVEVSSEHL